MANGFKHTHTKLLPSYGLCEQDVTRLHKTADYNSTKKKRGQYFRNNLSYKRNYGCIKETLTDEGSLTGLDLTQRQVYAWPICNLILRKPTSNQL